VKIIKRSNTYFDYFSKYTSPQQLLQHYNVKAIPPNKNPPAAKCFSEKSTNCEVPFLKIHQLLSIYTAVGGFLDQALCSWWIFRISTSQLVDFH